MTVSKGISGKEVLGITASTKTTSTKPTTSKLSTNKKTTSGRNKSGKSRKKQNIPPELALETYRPHEKINAGVVTVLNIKLLSVKRNAVTEVEQTERCAICMDNLFTAPESKPKPTKRRSRRLNLKRPTISKGPKGLRVVRLSPCGQLFHNKCIGEHVVGEKVSHDLLPVDDDDADETDDADHDLLGDIAGYEFATNSTTFFFERSNLPRPGEDGYIPALTEEDEAVAADDDQGVDPADTVGMIEYEGGWMSVDGERVVRKDTTIIVKFPVCRSHIHPSEEQFDFKEKWTKKERHFAKQWLHGPGLPNCAVRLARSGDSVAFAKDLEAARDFARIMVAEARC
jgi:hypothetical protein